MFNEVTIEAQAQRKLIQKDVISYGTSGLDLQAYYLNKCWMLVNII